MRAFLEKLYRVLALAGAVSFGLAALVTVVDVSMRKISSGIFGTVDYVQLFVITGAFLAMPYTFFYRGHVTVDIITERLQPKLRKIVQAITLLMTLCFIGFLFWYSVKGLILVIENNDISMNVGLPMWMYWGPFTFGLGMSVVAIIMLFFTDYCSSSEKNEPKSKGG